MAIQIVVFSDVRLYRQGVSGLLAADGRLEVVARAATLEAARELIRSHAPAAALVSVADRRGLRRVKMLARCFPDLRLIAIGVPDEESFILACAEAGVAGYVCLDSSVEELVSSVERALAGELSCSRRIAGALLERVGRLARQRPPEARGFRLTSREVQIVRLVDEGLTNKEIASRLHIELSTVKNHVHNILEKLDMHRRTEVARYARRAGWVVPGTGTQTPPVRAGLKG